MKKINIKDYKEKYVCYYNEYSDIELVGSDDVERIKEIWREGNIVFGTTVNKVFDEDFISEIQEYFEDYANDMGYKNINKHIDYKGESFKKIENAIREFIKNLGDANNFYSIDNVEIEVE